MNSKGNWVLDAEAGVYRAMRKFPRHDVEAIDDAFEMMKVNPFAGDVVKLKGNVNVWRPRVGSYRIFFEVDTVNAIITVFELQRRTSTTY